MKNSRRIAALISGIALYSTIIVCGSALSQMQPLAPIEPLLGGRSSLGAALAEAILIGGIVFLLSISWVYFTLRAMRVGRRIAGLWCLGGLAVGWLGWVLYGAAAFAMKPQISSLPAFQLLLATEMAPLWGILNAPAALIGAMLARPLAQNAGRIDGKPAPERVAA